MEEKRHLSSSEIDQLIGQIDAWNDTDCVLTSVKKTRQDLRFQLENKMITPANIGKLEKIIKKRWKESHVCIGEPVGISAATNSTHGVTQNVLNTFHHAGVGGISVNATTMGLKQIKQLLHASHLTEKHAVVYIKEEYVNKHKTEMDKLIFLNSVSKQLQSCYLYNLCGSKGDQHKSNYIKISKGLRVQKWWKIWIEVHSKQLQSSSFVSMSTIANVSNKSSNDWWTVVIKLNKSKVFRYEVYPFQVRKAINATNTKGVWCMENPMNESSITLIVSRDAIDFDDFIINQYTSRLENSNDAQHNDAYARIYIKERIIKSFMTEKPKNPNYALISGITGITNSSIKYDPIKKCWYISTDGSNLPALFSNPLVDEQYTISDDIHEIHEYLGMEGVKHYLFQRLNIVDGFSGNDPAHLMLIIDHMTNVISIKGLNRHGLEEENASPLGQIAFEQVGKNLTLAASTSSYEPLTGISARVLMGQPVFVGTNGPFEVEITNTPKLLPTTKRKMKKGLIPIGNRMTTLLMDNVDTDGVGVIMDIDDY